MSESSYWEHRCEEKIRALHDEAVLRQTRDFYNQQRNYQESAEKPRTFRVGDAVQTRDGRKARIVCDDAARPAPLISLVTICDGVENVCWHSSSGRSVYTDSWDLIPAPRKRTVWMNVYDEPDIFRGEGERIWADIHASKVQADACLKPGCVRAGCMRIELEEGRFDRDPEPADIPPLPRKREEPKDSVLCHAGSIGWAMEMLRAGKRVRRRGSTREFYCGSSLDGGMWLNDADVLAADWEVAE